MIGRQLKQYRIVEAIGAGGMGEVYRAHDEKLDRDVALKVLPAGALADDAARRRFRKEALALSRLSHPHVAALFDFDTTEEGVDFLVMELVSGPSLDLKLRRGPLPEKDIVRLGSQILRALAAAHEQGIIHRDLKPQNIRLTSDGLVKVLDFGLARLIRTSPGAATTATTDTDVVAGTPPYMSPEQLLGKLVDARTDVYAAGVVLYEMATGQRPFGDASGPPLVAKILSETAPPPRDVNPSLARPLEQIIVKATDRDPDLRYQAARELLVDLERLGGGQALSGAREGAAKQVVAGPARWRRRRWLLAAGAAAAVIGWALWQMRPLPPPRIRGFTRLAGAEPDPFHGLATDGRSLFFIYGAAHELRRLSTTGDGEGPVTIPLPSPLKGTADPLDYSVRHNALLMREGELGRLWMLPLPGGTPRRLGDIEAGPQGGAAWSPDGTRLAFTRERALYVAGGDGSRPEKVAELDGSLRGVLWSPDGRRVRVLLASEKTGTRAQIGEIDLEDSRHTLRPIARAFGYYQWSWPPGTWTRDGRYYVFADQDASARGSRIVVQREAGTWPWSRPQEHSLHAAPDLWAFPVASPVDDRVFAVNAHVRGELMRFEGPSGWRSAFPGLGSAEFVDFTRDGAWATWVAWPEGTLWRARVDGSEKLALTKHGEFDWVMLPRWSPDGRQVAFAGTPPGGVWMSFGLYLVKADGGPAVPLPAGNDWRPDICWRPDGRSLLFSSRKDPSEGILQIDSETRAVSVLEGSEGLATPKCGPSGEVLASEVKTSNHTTHILDPATGRWRRLPVGSDGLGFASFSRDGRAVYGVHQGEIIRLDLATMKARVVAGLDIPMGGILNFWLGLAPDDSPLVLANRTDRGIYALDLELP